MRSAVTPLLLSLSQETRCFVDTKQKAVCHPEMTHLTYYDTQEINHNFENGRRKCLAFRRLCLGSLRRRKHVLATQVHRVCAYISVLFVVVYTVAVKMSPLEVISVTHIIKSITNTMKLGLRHVASVKDICVYS